MTIDLGVDPTAAAAAASAANKANGVKDTTGGTDAELEGVDFNTFLTLLVTQLKNQDPLNPMDNAQFTSQIAQFSQLEQQIKSNSYLASLNQTQQLTEQNLAASAIGREGLIQGSVVGLPTQGNANFGYKLSDAAAKVTITISDANGNVVKTLDGDGTAGPHLISWDGSNNDGDQVDAGQYKVSIKATDANGATVAGATYTYGVITEAAMDGSGNVNVVTLDGRNSLFSDVISLRAYVQGDGVVPGDTASSGGTGDGTQTGDNSGDSGDGTGDASGTDNG
jgi:flagellar basal-body rod modification protein FlgD